MDFIVFGLFWTISISSVSSTATLDPKKSEVIEISSGCPFSFDTGNQGFEYKKPKDCSIGSVSLISATIKTVNIDTPFKINFVEYPDEDAYFVRVDIKKGSSKNFRSGIMIHDLLVRVRKGLKRATNAWKGAEGENNKNPSMMRLKSEFMGSQAKFTLIWSSLGYEGPVHFIANVFFNATLFWTISSDVYQIPLTPQKNEEIDDFGNKSTIYVDRSILRGIFRNQNITKLLNSNDSA